MMPTSLSSASAVAYLYLSTCKIFSILMLHNYNFIKMSKNNKSGKGLILRTKGLKCYPNKTMINSLIHPANIF